MKHLTFHFDLVSPYAYLAFQRLPVALKGCTYRVSYRPVLFAGLLKRWGQLGPAEIAPKRDWTYRQVAWLAHRHGVVLKFPAAHPFNPLALLRVLLAHGRHAGEPGAANRWACEQAFNQVWQGGAAGDGEAAVQQLAATLRPADPASLLEASQGDEVKALLRGNTEAATAAGVFGVPTIEVDGRHFWGVDALEMLAGYLQGDPWFDTPAWDDAAKVPQGITRR